MEIPQLKVRSDEDCPDGLVIWKDPYGKIVGFQGTPQLLKEYLKRVAIRAFNDVVTDMKATVHQ